MRLLTAAFVLLICMTPDIVAQDKEPDAKARAKYAVVVSNKLYEKEDDGAAKWPDVIDKLKKKYKATVFRFEGSPDSDGSLRKELARYQPYYVCFVSRPEHCGRNFVQSAIKLMHSLDDDPYDDAIWAILTGYTADDALEIVKSKPLTVKCHLSHVGGGWLEWFESGVSFNEGAQFDKRVKKKGKAPEKVEGPADTTEQWVKEVNGNKVDIVSSSGHATERDWQMGYKYRSGRIVPAGKGSLAGVASDGKRHDIKTSNPKIYFSPGNCLIAHIPSNLKDCMCLSWIHNGCRQFFGHVDLQTRWCAAWGIATYFFSLQDAYTFSEAVYVNRVASRYVADTYQKGQEKQYHDRCLNITVLYGDPAWSARMKRSTDPLYEVGQKTAKTEDGGLRITITVSFKRDCTFNERYVKPPVALLSQPISNWKVEKSDAKATVVCDNFIMLDLTGNKYGKGDKVAATVVCEPVDGFGLDPSTAADYAYLDSGRRSSPLAQSGAKTEVKGLPLGQLCFHEGQIWSRYLSFDPVGRTLRTHESLPEETFQAGGMCSDGKLLWILDTLSGKLCPFEVRSKDGKSRLAPAGGEALSLPCTRAAAVTFAKGDFYVLDTMHNKIFVVGAKGETKGGIISPSDAVADLAYDGAYFWAADDKRKAVYMFDEHGVIILNVPLSFTPKGIAHDGKTLWISSAGGTCALLQLKLNKKQKYTLGASMDSDITFSAIGRESCHIAIPQNSNRQEVQGRITATGKPETVEDNWKQKALKFAGDGSWTLRVRLHDIRYYVLPEQAGDFSGIPKTILDAYTVDGEMLKLTSKPVKEAAQDVEQLVKKWKKKRTPYWVARCAYEYLIQKVHYERLPGWVDAPTLLVRGVGTCSPISFTYVALCRALGLPARFSAGTRYRGKDPCIDQEFHRWCEIYLPNYGWVPVDPSGTGKSPSPLTSIARWGSVPCTDLVMTRGGGGSSIFGWAYNGAGGPLQASWSNVKSSKGK